MAHFAPVLLFPLHSGQIGSTKLKLYALKSEIEFATKKCFRKKNHMHLSILIDLESRKSFDLLSHEG